MKSSVLVSDLHLTSLVRDEYRWNLFPWLKKLIDRESVSRVWIVGDLTDAKDYHPSSLVNRVVKELTDLASYCDELIVLKGNHDGVDENLPYFAFLNAIPKLRFIVKPTVLREEGILLLPHTKTPEEDWKERDISRAKYILIHATVTGCISESGQQLEGVSRGWFMNTAAKIYAGDIHVPQTVGQVEYVGAPYHVRFGDKFEPRVVYIDEKGKAQSIKTENVRRHTLTISSPDALDAAAKGARIGDQVKVRIKLARSDYSNWHQYKKEVTAFCKEMGFQLVAIDLEREPETSIARPRMTTNTKKTPTALLEKYGKAKGLPDPLLALGKTILQQGVK